MAYATLPETTLATIVRDEIMNPAGGIEKFLTATLPHVEAAVVVDTGSIDGTTDVLSRLQREYPHLKVFHREWDSFAPSRNFSLSKVETKRVLILDADELLTHEDYKVMAEFMQRHPIWGYWFTFLEIYPTGAQLRNNFDRMNPRLFEVNGVQYKAGHKKGNGEDIPFEHSVGRTLDAPVEIKHFLPSPEAKDRKDKNWYENGGFLATSPYEAAKRDGWKEFNGGRNLFR